MTIQKTITRLSLKLLIVMIALALVPTGQQPIQAQTTNLIITGVIDGPLTGGLPKAIELYALTDIADLSIYGLGSANNGGGSDGEEFTFPADSATAGDFIYVATETIEFTNFFGFAPDYTNGSAPSINGDDAIELFQNGNVVDIFGEINVDGTGQDWEHTDGWAYRVDGTGPDGTTFVLANWTFSGPNALDGETTNDSAATPFPLGSYSTDGNGGGSGQPLPLTENFDSCALPGWQIVSVDTDQANTWSCSEQFSNIQANGFGNDAPANEWLITPALDMDAQDDEVLAFRNYTDFSDSGTPYPQLSVKYSTDYDGGGDPTTATWTDLSGITFSPADSGQWVDSGNIDLSGINGSTVYFAFQYISSGTSGGSAALWRLDAVEFFVDDTGGGEFAFIHEVQGAGLSVTNPGATVTVEGVVVGDYQGSEELRGFFIQEEADDEDGNDATSEGIFVYCNDCPVDVVEGNIVEVTGVQEEFFAMSQIDVPAAGSDGGVTVIDGNNNLGLVAPVQIDLPASAATNAEDTFEAYEGMLAQFGDQLTATEFFQLGRFGQVVLSEGGRQIQFTDANAPSVSGYAAHLEAINRSRIILDDLNNNQNIDPVYHPQPGGFSVNNFFRGGYTVNNLTGVLHWSFAGSSGTNAWRIRPQITNPVTFSPDNPRTATPDDVGGSLKVTAFNVLNYFTTIDTGPDICGPNNDLDCRGAHSQAELDRQTAKIVAALKEIDADIVGLVELENNATASLQALVDALNVEGVGPYDFINTGTIGGDAIKVGLIYKPATVTPVGDFKILDATVDSDFIDTKNRPVLIQTFDENATGGRFTAALNHLKSKGSPCDDVGDPDANDGQGNCNQTRTKAAQALVDYLATDPTGSEDPDFLIMGDLNAYAQEAPITTIEAAGYTDLIEQFVGSDAYSFVFDGQWGYLDHALATASLTDQVTGVTEWHINADEVNLLDYNDTIQDPAEASFEAKPSTNELYNPDPYRASDHDPLVIGLNLTGPVVEVPQCNGVDATIYVNAEGKIVGGPNDGQTYRRILRGTFGADVMVGTDLNEAIIGYAGDDLICGLGGRDKLDGRLGQDTLFGGAGRDLLQGRVGHDTLNGEAGKDWLNGGAGNDTCDGGDDKDIALQCETKVNIP